MSSQGKWNLSRHTAGGQYHGETMYGLRTVALPVLALALPAHAIAQPDPASVESTVEAHLEAAQAAQRDKDYAGAAREYAAIVALQPDSAPVRQSFGVSLHLAGQYPEAIRQLSEAVRLDDTLWGAYLFLGMDYYRTGRFEEAVKSLERSLEINGGLVEGRRWLGLSCAALGRFEEAIGHLSAVLESAEHDEEALYHLTRAYDNRATQIFEQLGRSDPTSPFVYLLQAERFAFEGEAERAHSEYRRAIEVRPDLAGTIQLSVESVAEDLRGAAVGGPFLAVRNLYSAGRYEEAARDAKAALEAGLGQSEARFWLGRAYKGLAKGTLRQLVDVAPDSYRADQLAAEFYASRTEFSEALAAYQRALRKRPDLPGLRYAIGVVHWRRGRLDEAVEWLEKELDRTPHHTLAHHRLGSILMDQGRTQDAIPHLEAALSANPALGEARLDLGRAYLNRGDPASAAREFELFSRSEPSNERARFLLATAYRALGRTDDAEREIKVYQSLSRERLRRVQRDVRSVSEDIKGALP